MNAGSVLPIVELPPGISLLEFRLGEHPTGTAIVGQPLPWQEYSEVEAVLAALVEDRVVQQ